MIIDDMESVGYYYIQKKKKKHELEKNHCVLFNFCAYAERMIWQVITTDWNENKKNTQMRRITSYDEIIIIRWCSCLKWKKAQKKNFKYISERERKNKSILSCVKSILLCVLNWKKKNSSKEQRRGESIVKNRFNHSEKFEYNLKNFLKICVLL